jgi:transposase
LRRDIMIDELHEVNRRIKLVEKHLRKIADAHPGVMLLMSIPGVGIRTAEAFVAYVDDINRFTRINQVGAYFGLVPRQDASGNFNRLGHITKDGPPTMRKLLTEAAWQGIKRSPAIRGFFKRVGHDDPQRRKIALVATAHYLVRVMATMLRTGELWRYEDKKGRPRDAGPTMEGAPLRKTPHA